MRGCARARGLLQISNELLIACLGGQKNNRYREILMRDIAFVLVTALFFVLGILYLRGCERLK
jgi:hypothetical protein